MEVDQVWSWSDEQGGWVMEVRSEGKGEGEGEEVCIHQAASHHILRVGVGMTGATDLTTTTAATTKGGPEEQSGYKTQQ